ncbi:MAG: hypothetical protein ABL955_02520 [Elusimicrobiota bacterium]
MVKTQNVVMSIAQMMMILSVGLSADIAEAGKNPPTATSPLAQTEFDSGWPAEIAADTARNETDRKQLESLPPNSPEAQQIQRNIGQRGDKAESYADRAPTNVPVLTAAVDQALGNGDVGRAQGRADQAVIAAEAETDPKKFAAKWPLAMNTRAKVAKAIEDYPAANAYALKVLEKFPKDRNALALFRETKDRTKVQPTGAGTQSAAGGGGAGPATPRTNAWVSSMQSGGPGVAMTSASALEVQKHLALGWSRLKLDPAAALKSFDAAVAADPKNAAVRVQRSKARLSAGDAPGAHGDAEDALALEPRLGEAYAARADAKRALGRAEAELLSDYEAAAKFDGRFTDAYKALVTRSASASFASAPAGKSNADMAGRSAPDGFWGLLTHPPKKWGLLALICVFAAAVGGVLAPLLLKRPRSGSGATPTPTPRP